MVDPEADGRGGGHLARSVPADLEQHLPVIIRHRHALAAVILRMNDGLGGFVRRPGDDVHRGALLLCGIARHLLYRAPHAAVEPVLDLRRAVGAIIRLVLHRAVSAAVRGRDLMPARVNIARAADIHAVTVAAQIHLILRADIRIECPRMAFRLARQ